jgi:hypothetical protein
MTGCCFDTYPNYDELPERKPYVPPRRPFFKRPKTRRLKYVKKDRAPRFVREHTLCGEPVPCARFLFKRSDFRFPRAQVYRRLSGLTAKQFRTAFHRKYVRIVVPKLIAAELVGVQPMTGPVGLIYSLRYNFGDLTSENNSAIITAQ